MGMIDWAFDQDLASPEKLMLVWIASNASCNGVAPQGRNALEQATGYKTRSVQRILKSLRESGHVLECGNYFVIGPADPVRDLACDSAKQLPDHDPVLGSAPSQEVVTINTVEPDEIASLVRDYMIDQLANFEQRIIQHLKRAAMVPRETEPPPPPPDPVLVNPLYQELLDLGKSEAQAYALSKADLAMADELDRDLMPGEAGPLPDHHETDSEYTDDIHGRYTRVLDILHGVDAGAIDSAALQRTWERLELDENKHTRKGETKAFELLYPAIVASAKEQVGIMTMVQFLDPEITIRSGFKSSVTHGVYPWERSLTTAEHDDPKLLGEISAMITELEATGDIRCEVHARTQETGDDGVTRYETALGYHRRVTAKYNEMLRLKEMEII